MKGYNKFQNRKRLRKNIRKFSQKKVDYAKYMRDIYVENGLAFISCNVKGIDDIVDPYSVKGYEWLNESFARYIESNAAYIPTEYPIVLEIIGGHFNDKQKAIIEETILDYYGLSLGDKQIDLYKNRRKIFIIALICVVIFAIASLIDAFSYNTIFQESVMILVWFFVEDLVELLLDRIDLREEKTDAAQLASLAIRFSDKFVDEPVPDDEAEEIIAEIFEEGPEEIESSLSEPEEFEDDEEEEKEEH
ncbi:MAG: hypothetical protein IKF39_03910 [Oscillospiraceae bacterium]|nr:hypothetical protein [Oscillospiraceae bacterium]